MGYTLLDGIAHNAAHPETFWIPSKEDIDAKAVVGSHVKLAFEDSEGAERMWVKVTEVNGDQLKGYLDNHPINMITIKHGAVIEFEKKNIIDLF